MMQPMMQPMVMVQQTKNTGSTKIVLIIVITVGILVIGAVVLSGILYVWASSLAESVEEGGPLNTYMVEDSMSSISAGDTDELVKLSFLSWNQDLNWVFLEIDLNVEENGESRAYRCLPDQSQECFIQESRSDDYWKGDEIIFLQENGADICSDECIVSVLVNYKGRPISGDTGSFTII